jgi:hypothetical protein
VREKRSDVVAGQAGAPLTLDLYVYRSDDSCEPEPGAVVDIWHCNTSGLYSDEAANGTGGQRAHLQRLRDHLQLHHPDLLRRRKLGRGLRHSPYNSRSGRDTTNEEDMIYLQEVKAGNVLMPTLGGSPSAGYSGTVGIGLSGLPVSTSSGSGSSSSSGSNGLSSSDTAVDATLVSRRFIHAGARRELLLGLKAGERIAAEAKLMRGGRAIAHKKIAALAPGKRNLAVPISDAAPAGAAQLRLTLTDRAGNSRTVHKHVQIPTGWARRLTTWGRQDDHNSSVVTRCARPRGRARLPSARAGLRRRWRGSRRRSAPTGSGGRGGRG